ncbi:hypothetical protein B0H10DRAFT_1798398, partial [Mycena sp. CBHHK59/15]
LLHVPDDIRFCGPSWTTWTFWMERYCGFLQAGLRSRHFPWANLNNNILQKAYVEQLGARYDIENELSSVVKSKHALSKSEYIYDGCGIFLPSLVHSISQVSTLPRSTFYFAASVQKELHS